MTSARRTSRRQRREALTLCSVLLIAASPRLALAQRAAAATPSCALVSESTIAVPRGPLLDARLAINERGGAVTLSWAVRDEVEGHDRWGGYASWDGPIPRQPVSFERNAIVGGACAPPVELRATVFDGLPCVASYAVYDPRDANADPMIRYGVAFDRPSLARSTGQHLELERLAEAHTASATLVAAWGMRSRGYGGLCDLDERWRGVSVADDAPRELRLLTFAPGRAPSAQLLYSETPAMLRAAAASASAGPESSAMALAVGADGGVAIWPSRGRMYALSFSSAGVADGVPRELSSGRFGAPAIVARGRAFDAAWARLNDATGRYELVGASFTDRRSPAAITALAAPPSGNAFAPALSTQGPRVVLAWTEGDLTAAAVVKAGSSSRSLAQAASSAAVIGAARGNRRDPELSSTASGTWMLVQQFERRARNGVARIATLRCDGP